MKVVVDFDQCDGNGLCAAVAPELFALDENDQLHVLEQLPPPAHWSLAESAAQACPKLAISLEEQR